MSSVVRDAFDVSVVVPLDVSASDVCESSLVYIMVEFSLCEMRAIGE